MRLWSGLVSFFSGEWLLTKCKLGNGGSIIVVRSLWTTLWIYAAFLGLRNLIDPARTWEFEWDELRLQLLETAPWLAGIVAGIYTAFYARFASQWTYLANLYNQIKGVECRISTTDPTKATCDPLAEWKAGFIEDAEELHLATKPIFASVIKRWTDEESIQQQYCKNTPGGLLRFKAIRKKVLDAESRRGKAA